MPFVKNIFKPDPPALKGGGVVESCWLDQHENDDSYCRGEKSKGLVHTFIVFTERDDRSSSKAIPLFHHFCCFMGGWACSWKDSKCSVLSKRWKITDFKDENFVPTHPFDSQQALVSLPVALGKSLRSLLLKWCCGGAECHRIWQEWPSWKELWNSHPPAPYFIRKVMEWFFEQIISTPVWQFLYLGTTDWKLSTYWVWDGFHIDQMAAILRWYLC